jgi:DNA-binding transcriptional LysR family regulator
MGQNRTSTAADVSVNMLPQLASFVAVVDAGSFTAAARQTSSDKTVLSRRVTALEQALGVRLLNRTTRSLHVTDAGRRLVDEARHPVQDALAALVRMSAPDHLEGVVKVASAQSLGQSIWVPVLAQLREAHPRLRVELSTSETFSPLVEQGYELGVRVGRMPDSGLISRKLGGWSHVLVASPGWVAAHSQVKSPIDLPEHWLLWGGDGSSAQQWKFAEGEGEECVDVRMDRSAVVHDTSQLLTESARAGLGVAAMPPFSVARELTEGSLVRVLPSWRPIHELGVFAVTPHRTLLPARVHVVLEAVRARVTELVPVWAEMTR